MESHLSPRFRELLGQLPQEVRRDAKKSYRLWKLNPFRTGLFFKEVNKPKRLWSVRASLGWRALGVRTEPDIIVWVWIGPHAEYDEIIKPKNVKKMQSP